MHSKRAELQPPACQAFVGRGSKTSPKKPWGHWCEAQGEDLAWKGGQWDSYNCPEERDLQASDEKLLEDKVFAWGSQERFPRRLERLLFEAGAASGWART